MIKKRLMEEIKKIENNTAVRIKIVCENKKLEGIKHHNKIKGLRIRFKLSV